MKKLRTVNYLVVHCSATSPDKDIGYDEIDTMHKNRGFDKCGYHYIIRRDGTLEEGRDLGFRGAHAKGYNWQSIGICVVGGIDKDGKAEDNFEVDQYVALHILLKYLQERYPNAKILGHRDLSPDLNGDGEITRDEYMKECPCFHAGTWFEEYGGSK